MHHTLRAMPGGSTGATDSSLLTSDSAWRGWVLSSPFLGVLAMLPAVACLRAAGLGTGPGDPGMPEAAGGMAARGVVGAVMIGAAVL